MIENIADSVDGSGVKRSLDKSSVCLRFEIVIHWFPPIAPVIKAHRETAPYFRAGSAFYPTGVSRARAAFDRESSFVMPHRLVTTDGMTADGTVEAVDPGPEPRRMN
jgi:hypothetical protein